MTRNPSCRRGLGIAKRRSAWRGWRRHECSDVSRERGFTLVELLIVVTVLPLVVGALSYGLLTVLQLQTGVANRLANTSDSQVVLSDFSSDVQSATYITTQNGTTSQCGAGTQILGLEWGQSTSAPYNFEDVVSYTLQQFSGSSTTSLVRQYCTTTATGSAISSSTTSTASNGAVLANSVILSNNFPSGYVPLLSPSAEGTLASSSWVPATSVSSVSLTVTESLTSDSYTYTLVGVPNSTSAATSTGTPDVASNNTTCGFATAGTGPFANNLCFIDFSSLTGARLAAAYGYSTTNGVINCGLEMSSTLPGNFTMYFCLGISGTNDVVPVSVPTFGQAALGNDIFNAADPFYIGIPGEPALDQNMDIANNSTITFSNINVVNQEGQSASGWQWFSADAEATGGAGSNNQESITWSSNSSLSTLPNGFPWDTSSQPGNTNNSIFGNACYGGLITTNIAPSGQSIECLGLNPPAQQPASLTLFTGTAMVYGGGANSELQANLVSPGGEEAISFGVLTSGEGAR